MKENLKTFPTGRSIWSYQRWKENFEKELREVVKDAEKMAPAGPYRGIVVLGKEILGEIQYPPDIIIHIHEKNHNPRFI